MSNDVNVINCVVNFDINGFLMPFDCCVSFYNNISFLNYLMHEKKYCFIQTVQEKIICYSSYLNPFHLIF